MSETQPELTGSEPSEHEWFCDCPRCTQQAQVRSETLRQRLSEQQRQKAGIPSREADAEHHLASGGRAGDRESAQIPMGGLPWRVGRQVGRTVYDADERLIGVMDTPELAQQVVDGVNAQDPNA